MANRIWTTQARILVAFGVLGSCGSLTWWLLAAKTRGAQIAAVLGPSIGLCSLLFTVLAFLGRPYDLRHEALTSAARGLAVQVRAEWARTRQRLLADVGDPRPADVGYVHADEDSAMAAALVRWRSDGGSERGSLADIAAYYATLGRGRLVILGEPGAGKTVLAIQLLIELIAALPEDPGGDRLRVPVLLSASSWQVSDIDVDDSELSAQFDAWLARTLTGTYRIPESVSKALVTGY